ncbi:MAG: hypothetical protein PHU65_08025 [Actinomycetota bacterium]|nr:hypothetical protein [Actinomycetota bacterium]
MEIDIKSQKKNKIQQDPVFNEKKQIIASLKSELAKLICDRDIAENTVKKNLEALYVTKVGKNEYELFALECQAARLRRKIQLMQKSINHGRQINAALIEKQLDIEYEEWEAKITKMLTAIAAGKARLKALMPQKESRQLQNLYRELVKKLHPDVNETQTEKQKLLWNQTQQAYQNGDIEELKTIKLLLEDTDKDSRGKEEYDGSSDKASKESALKNIEKTISLLKEKVFKIMEYIKELKSEFPFTIEYNIKDDEWVSRKNREISEKQEIIKSQIKDLKDVIDSLVIDNINRVPGATIN